MNYAKIQKDMVDAAIGAKTHFDVWWTLASEGRLRFKQSFKSHSDYLGADSAAHYIAFFICFSLLFDKTKRGGSIAKWLKLGEAKMGAERYKALSSSHDELFKRAEPLLTIRNNLVAHLNAIKSEADVFSELNITWFAMRDIIYDTVRFLADAIGISSPSDIGIPRDGRLYEATIALLRSLGEECDA